jgi:hypothetical protein
MIMAREFQHQRSRLDDFVADLTEAAYPVALRHGLHGKWLDLELDLWRVLREKVQQWERRFAQTENPPEGVDGDARYARHLSPFHA